MTNRNVFMVALAASCVASVSLAADRAQLKDRDRLQTFSLTQQRDQTRLKECLPAELQASVKDMTQARDKYQQQLRDQQKDAAVCTDEARDRLRDQIKDQIKDQTKDREQVRERLQELRQTLPTHQELMDQAREQTRTAGGQTRRGE